MKHFFWEHSDSVLMSLYARSFDTIAGRFVANRIRALTHGIIRENKFQ